ncbi:hypothetical protein C8R41DRAFT_869942 [Lentinula lateritia]|uniref:Uncharacterized protein n=1 Tax=Lentinula lateritia TaxID=40482 RepID=A0ABQ8V572_9AGAR|nr:hypothetical protein C8R41DRAFT_869942 [Lentinula lateritia]
MDEDGEGDEQIADDFPAEPLPRMDSDADDDDNELSNEGDNRGAVFPVQSHGVIDVNGNGIPQSELVASALENMSGRRRTAERLGQPDEHFFVRHGQFANEYPHRDESGTLTSGEPDNPNHLLGCFPTLFPYGEGGFETPRKHQVSYEAHSKWALQYADWRFCYDLQFVFQIFSVQQKRAICASAAVRMKWADYVKHRRAMEKLTEEDFKKAAEEEKKKKPFSNLVIRALVSHLSADYTYNS